MGTTKTTKGKSTSAKPTKKAAKAKAASAASTSGDTLLVGVRGEREQLATIRQKLPALTERESSAFLSMHSPETCRQRASSTKARDVFRIAMSWARTIGANPTDKSVHPKRARWFLDCATALGELLAGTGGIRNPSVTSALADAQSRVGALTIQVRAAVIRALGDDSARVAEVRKAFAPPAHDARAQALRNAKLLIGDWLKDETLEARLALHDVTSETLGELESAAAELEAATATRGAASQADRDTPAENEAEGRLLVAMKWVWLDFKEARKKGLSSLTLQVSPAILRGLAIGKSGEDREDSEEGDTDGT
jgi:hypothetical protein